MSAHRPDVLRAIKEAREWNYKQWMSDNTSTATASIGHLPDSTPIRLYSSAERPVASVRYYDRGDLMEILEALHHYGGYVNFMAAREAFSHEDEHTEAAMLLGCKAVDITQHLHISMQAGAGGRPEPTIGAFTTDVSMETTKLGATLLALYPRSKGGPSEGDLAIAEHYGHTVESAARAAIAHNEELVAGDPRVLPVPLTHSDAQANA